MKVSISKGSTLKRLSYRCPKCGGERCGKDAIALWNDDEQQFSEPILFDQNFCTDCGEIGEMEEVALEPEPVDEKASIRRVLDLSTAHLTQVVAGGMTDGSLSIPVSVMSNEYGFLVSTACDVEDATVGVVPPCLKGCILKARELNCSYILFDRDAALFDTLPAYDW